MSLYVGAGTRRGGVLTKLTLSVGLNLYSLGRSGASKLHSLEADLADYSSGAGDGEIEAG